MKKSLVLFGILFVISLEVSAQLSVGVRGGFSTSSITYRPEPGRPAINTANFNAPLFGFVAEYFGNKNAGIALELHQVSLGYTQRDSISGGVNQTELRYLKMPLLSNFYFGNSGRFHIKLGPHVGVLMNAKDISREVVDNPIFLPTYGQVDDNPDRFMYGLTLGAGLSKLFGKSTLAGDVRFSYEFGRPESQNRIFDMNSTTIEVSLSYMFQLVPPKWKKE
ncbi:porin family protein [Mongoliitalea daihaiensis]|uniref:porin family protein n=1 Tax=Mongoliitalea daihaiensis TaxID=2782006 RepID=UPI001F437ADA|nr:porin family protein [Mongoliitalea daihaiensis]UJP65399.1 PorT family protein [Mongoliitalea daihaiensis]